MADLNQLVQQRADLAKNYSDVLKKHQLAANAELNPIAEQQSEVQKQIDGILNTNAGINNA